MYKHQVFILDFPWKPLLCTQLKLIPDSSLSKSKNVVSAEMILRPSKSGLKTGVKIITIYKLSQLYNIT